MWPAVKQMCVLEQVQQMAVRCVQRNFRASSTVHNWSWWKLLCRVRPLLDINIDDQRFRAKEVRAPPHDPVRGLKEVPLQSPVLPVPLSMRSSAAAR